MHKSRLAGFIIDCGTDDLQSAASFWSRALGLARRKSTNSADALYAPLESAPGGLYVEVQKVSHASRVHLDIESDDIEAEVRRLEDLGARRISRVRDWVIMEAPTGQRFCVVPAASHDFEHSANQWN